MPRVAKQSDTTDLEVGQSKPREFVGETLNESDIDIIDKPNWKDKAKMEAFMAEMVTVNVHDTTAPNADPIVEIWVNGRVQRFLRGLDQTVKRKYVFGLVRAKKTTFGQEKFKNEAGDDAYRYPTRTAPEYPFTVKNDTPQGREWLKKVMLET